MISKLLVFTTACILASTSPGLARNAAATEPAVALETTSVDFDELLINGTSQYAKNKEEPIIRHFFRDRRDGVFLDVGCYLPRKASTTFYLEDELGWSGIAIDAEEGFRGQWEKARPRSKFFAYAVTDKSDQTITFYAAGSIGSVEKRNIEFWEKAKNIDIKERKVTVPTITLTDLLDRQGVEKIDFLSIDINGFEPTAMSAFDIKRFRPELVHIEVHKRNEKLLSDYFERNGYRRIDEYLEYDRSNWYFTPKDDPNIGTTR